MQHRQRFVPGHIDLVQDTEASLLGTLIDRTGTESYLTVLKSIRTYHQAGIHVNMKRNIPERPPESRRQILCQHVFAGRLGAYQE